MVVRMARLALLAPLLQGATAFEAVPCNVTTYDCGLEFLPQIYKEFQQVRSEVVIMPFFIRPKLKIFSSVEGQAPDLSLQDVLVQVLKRGVHVWILGWDNAASEKMLNFHQDSMWEELFQASGGDHEHLHLMLDTGRSFIASMYYLPHIKAYSFDRKVAFVGGMDFAENRLDTPQHVRPDPRLVKVKKDKNHVTGNEKPWQDVMVRVEGAAAEHVALVLVERWWTYCKSEGYLRAQAMRPFTAVADTLWKVDGSLSVSKWKSYQCATHPAPGRLGTVQISVHSGGARQIKYHLDIVVPQVQSKGVPKAEKKRVTISSGQAMKVPLEGLRGLDKALPASITFYMDGQAFDVPSGHDAEVDLIDGDKLMARWLPNGVPGVPIEGNIIGRAASEPELCRLALSGDHMWMGTDRIMADNLDAHIKIIQNAKKYIYIENQYFVTDFDQDSEECRNSHERTQAVLYGNAHNKVGTILMEKLREAARTGSNFNVAIVLPLATEPGSFYPNLRSMFCFEQAVEEMWQKEAFASSWRDYFSFFFIANAVPAPPDMGGPGSAFYGIFTHTKTIIADDEVALVGSANVNDRSLNGDRDAEVGFLVSGGSFPRRFREKLLQGHLGDSSLADPERLLHSMMAVATANAQALKASMGISFPEGTVSRPGKPTQRLLGLKDLLPLSQKSSDSEALLKYPDSRVIAGGGGVDTFQWFVVPGATAPKLHGLLFPWSREIWGLPKMTDYSQLLSNELNWRRRLEERRNSSFEAPSLFV